ncbi:TPA: DUF551 domain-containing protein [Klebsiella pneumoniae]|nr:DUF551 domain-containing protein [Klebsiella pneumoniae]MDG0482861.1 DUF551 domain-containing protein [Klebsiella pneumoniae]MDJ1062446.1 DUF551 domain-containing protein [Klebsiella pneumoniae]
MTKSTITRDELNEVIATYGKHHIAHRMANVLLAAMDSEPHTDGELSNLLWYSQEATCHSDPNYYCEFQHLATPGLIAGIIRELQERRKADSEPVAYMYDGEDGTEYNGHNEFSGGGKGIPLYRHAQPAPEKYNIGDATMRHIFTPTGMTNVSDMQAVFDRVEAVLVGMEQPAPVVPDDYQRLRELYHAQEKRLFKITQRIKGPTFDKYAHTPSQAIDVLEEALFGNDAPLCHSVMLAAAPQLPGSEPATLPGKWIPVSERMPEIGDIVLTAMGGVVNVGEMECSAANCRFFTSVISGRELPATHWMPMPTAPQEVK